MGLVHGGLGSSEGRCGGDAWMDRTVFVEDQRDGELLSVVSADPSRVILELVSAANRQYRFTRALSSEASRLSGSWDGLNAQSSFRRIQ